MAANREIKEKIEVRSWFSEPSTWLRDSFTQDEREELMSYFAKKISGALGSSYEVYYKNKDSLTERIDIVSDNARAEIRHIPSVYNYNTLYLRPYGLGSEWAPIFTRPETITKKAEIEINVNAGPGLDESIYRNLENIVREFPGIYKKRAWRK